MVDRLGERFGNYTLTRLLGKGGFAEVYLGEHIHLGLLVAIKILRTQLVSEEQERFLQEARLIAPLDHPAIVRVLDYAVEQDTAFLVMQYAPHGTLRQTHPKGTRVTIADVVSYSKQIASALQYAHEHKVIHRDIKPENMLLGSQHEVLMSDFGIALISSSSSSQSTKEAAGTAIYMSPEQIIGKPRPASDQYALGVVIYEWLCGEPPFQGTFSELCAQHLYAAPPSMREKNPQVSQAVEQVVMTALAKGPQQRFANVQAFVNALEQASHQAASTITPFPVSPILPAATVSNDTTIVGMSPQEQNGTTVSPVSFFTTQLSDKATSEADDSNDISVEESQNARLTSVLPPLSTKPLPQTSLYGDVPLRNTGLFYPEGEYTTQNGLDEGKKSSVHTPSFNKPTGKTVLSSRKRIFLIVAFLTVLLVLFGSLALEAQQFDGSKAKTTTSTPVSTAGNTPITQPSQRSIGKASPTTVSKKTVALKSVADPSPNTPVILVPTATAAQLSVSTANPDPTSTPTPTAVPSTLSVSPSSMTDDYKGCQQDSHGGTFEIITCPFVLSNSALTKKTLSWTVSASLSGVSFDHSSGTIAPGKTATITMYGGGLSCPFNLTLDFTGTDNTIQVPLLCTQIYASPDQYTFSSSNCTNNGNWVCVITISASSSPAISTAWATTTLESTPGVTFSPAYGTLAPGGYTQVTVTIASTDCPGTSTTLHFYVPGGLADGANYLDFSC